MRFAEQVLVWCQCLTRKIEDSSAVYTKSVVQMEAAFTIPRQTASKRNHPLQFKMLQFWRCKFQQCSEVETLISFGISPM